MGISYARNAAGNLVDNLREQLIANWHDMTAKNEVPEDAEAYADSALHVIFDSLSGGVAMLNKDTGMHPDDPRDPRNDEL